MRRPADLPCLACGEAAAPGPVLLCAGCLGRAHPGCWSGACPACGARDALGPLDRRRAPVAPRRRARPRWRRVALLVGLGAGVTAALARPAPAPPGVIAVDGARPVVRRVSAWSDGVAPRPPAPTSGRDRAGLWRAVDVARTRLERGDRRGALAAYDLALTLWTDEPAPWAERARLRSGLGDHAGALADAGRVIDLAPRRLDGWSERGAALTALGRWDEAEAAWSRVLALAPHDAWAWSNRGLTRARAGDAAGARADARRALALAPGLPAALATLEAAGRT